MKKNRFLYFLPALLFLLCGDLFSQKVESLKFRKDPSLIYFFQKGKKSDTLHKSADLLFYLVASDTLKKQLSIQVENGQLVKTDNDSLVKLNFMPGFKYESFYLLNKSEEKKTKSRYEFQTAVDGTSILPQTKISITLINKSTGGLILENVFVYTD